MFIKKITLKNYRCYNEHTFDFTGPNEKNVVLLNGHNGAGKSTLFNAIGWCIFGEETQELLKTKEFSEEEKLIPYEFSYDEEGISRVEVKITLEFQDNNPIYQAVISRSASFQKDRQKPMKKPTVDISAYDKYNSPVNIDEDTFLSTIVPKQLASFYMFDTEWLKKYGDDTNIKVSNGIERLFRLNRFGVFSEVLSELSDKYKQKWISTGRKSVRNDDLADELKKKYTELSELEKNLKEAEDQRDKLEEERNKTENEARGLSDIAEIFEKYKEKVTKQDEVQRSRSRLEKELFTLKLSRGYTIKAKDFMKEVLKRIEKEEKDETIKMPPDVAPTFVNSLLEKGKCICGRPIENGGHEHHLIEELLKESTKDESNTYLTELKYKIENVSSDADELQGKLDQLSGQIKDEETRYDQISKEIDELKENAPKELSDLESLAKDYRRLIDKHSAYTKEIGRAQIDINKKNDKKKELVEEIKKKEDKLITKDLSAEEQKFLFLSNLTSILKEGTEDFASSAKREFSVLLQNELNSLLKDSPGFEHYMVEIESVSKGKFLRVHYKEVGEERFSLSGGQAEFMGIVLMIAFVKLLERFREESLTLPFIMMDNPFHDLGEFNTKRVYENLSNFFSGTQVILFMPDKGFKGIRDYSHNGLLRVFTLNNDRTTKTTSYEVMEGEEL